MQSHIPQNLYQFILDMLCGAENSSEIPEHIRLRCISVALDLIYCASKSRTKTAKHVALAITIKKLTGSKELIQILNRWGHSISYDDFLAAQTSLAIEQVAKQELVLNVPPDVTPGIFCQMAADNNDINEHTLDGQTTTHATTMVVFQKGVFGPIPKQRVLATHNKKQRSLSNNAPRTYANEYKALGKRPSIHDFIGSSASLLQPTAVLSPGSSFHQIWVIKRRYGMCSGWSRFIPLVSNYERDSQMIPTTVSYCPVLDESPTTYTTVYKVLKYLQSMMSQVGQDSSVITFDLAIYMKAREIKFRERDEFQDVVIRLGGFHIALNYLGVIGKCYESSGIEDLLIESGLYGASTTECVLKGKHYSRGVRTHRLLYEVILGMLWESFVNSGVTEPADIALFEENMHQDHANLATADVVSVMDAFRHYREKTGEKSQLSKFWIQYLDMVEVLFDFIMAERMSEWEDHLDATKRMIPYFAAMSRPNYARWLPVYALDMATLAEQFPDVYHAFTVGKSHTVSRTGQDFSAVWTDMALEQTINYDSKTKGWLLRTPKCIIALYQLYLIRL